MFWGEESLLATPYDKSNALTRENLKCRTEPCSGIWGLVSDDVWWFFLSSFVGCPSKVPFTPKSADGRRCLSRSKSDGKLVSFEVGDSAFGKG